MHFPIALLSLAWLCLVVRYATGWREWERQGRLFELIGLATLPFAILSAVIDTRGFEFLTRPRWDAPLIWHAMVGTASMVVFGLHVLWARRSGIAATAAPGAARRLVDLGAVTLGLWLVVLTAMIGGELVFST